MTHVFVHATLKSISHTKSSVHIKSVSTEYFEIVSPLYSVISHIAIQATGACKGTHASKRANVEAQTDACEVEPHDARHSETTLIV